MKQGFILEWEVKMRSFEQGWPQEVIYIGGVYVTKEYRDSTLQDGLEFDNTYQTLAY